MSFEYGSEDPSPYDSSRIEWLSERQKILSKVLANVNKAESRVFRAVLWTLIVPALVAYFFGPIYSLISLAVVPFAISYTTWDLRRVDGKLKGMLKEHDQRYGYRLGR